MTFLSMFMTFLSMFMRMPKLSPILIVMMMEMSTPHFGITIMMMEMIVMIRMPMMLPVVREVVVVMIVHSIQRHGVFFFLCHLHGMTASFRIDMHHDFDQSKEDQNFQEYARQETTFTANKHDMALWKYMFPPW